MSWAVELDVKKVQQQVIQKPSTCNREGQINNRAVSSEDTPNHIKCYNDVTLLPYVIQSVMYFVTNSAPQKEAQVSKHIEQY